jgi:diguanylate cyclase (GGDEF)-like protein/PAS domain S-box-containing protein
MLLFMGAMSVLSGMLVLDSYRNLENDDLSRNVSRLENLFSRESGALLRVNRDWSFWDDTYAYMDDLNKVYERVNLQPETLETLNLSAMVFLSPEGEVVAFAPSSSGEAFFLDWIRGSGPSLASAAESDGFSGSFLLEKGLFIVSGAPILRSDGSGPPKGVLVFAREIGEEAIASFSGSILLPLKIHTVGPSLPEDLREALASMESSETSFFSRPLSPDEISGFSVLRDIDGNPAGLIEITSRRHIFLQGKGTLIHFFLWLAVFGGFQTVLVLFLLKKTVTDRLESTRRILVKIASSGRVGERMPLSGRDEITSLSGSINSMLSSLERLVENIPDPLFLSDAGMIVHTNREACALLGIEKKNLEGKILSSFLTEEVPVSLPEDESPVFEGKLLPQNAPEIPVEIHRQTFLLGERTLTLSVARDITPRKELEDSLRKMAYFDEKTGLPNRSRFLLLAEEAIRSGEPFVVALLDMDRFRLINDMVGPVKGDDVLLEISGRIQGLLSPGDVLARTGGDGFGIILRKIGTWEDASPALIQVKKAVMTPIYMDGKTIFPSVSMGVLLAAEKCGSSTALLARAEIALLRAKGRGLGQTALFREDEAAKTEDILTAEGQLRNALEQGELRLHYQPIVRMKDKSVEGFEALIRWQHPERGLIPPGNFIPLAEETGLITEIDRWAARQACRDIARFADLAENGTEMRVSVNASARSILEGDYCGLLTAGAAAAGISPRLLTVEITEGVLIGNPEVAAASLGALRREGIYVALDDFGTGYSSLQYLNTLPIDRIKIDGSFVRRLFIGEGDRRLVKGILALADDLGMETVIECIERENEYLWALEQGTIYGQGYFFGYPRPFGEATEVLLKLP